MTLPRKVYAIQHNKTQKIYIGSSKDVRQRYLNHLYALRNNKHPNKDMQDDFNLYGEDYSLFILDEITCYAERKKEYEWMLKYNSTCREKGYNCNDREKETLAPETVPFADGFPMVDEENEALGAMKQKYISDIKGMVGQCNDISLLDIIRQLLIKSYTQH